MCGIDKMYQSNAEDEQIVDELLITLVKSNKALYDKSCKDFKNAALKKDLWTAISVGCGASSGEAAEQRWNALRNQLGKKVREMKAKLPSGSGVQKKPPVWPLLSSMEFLLPFIGNRRKRGSFDTQSTRSCDSPETGFLSPSPLASPTGVDSPSSVWDSSSEIFAMESEESVVEDGGLVSQRDSPSPAHSLRRDSPSPATSVQMKRSGSVVPPPDSHASKKKRSLDGVENIMKQSADAMLAVAASLQKEAPETEHPYMIAIKKAFEEVFKEKELDCFRVVLDVISKFTKNNN